MHAPNYNIPQLPDRSNKPRARGLTMAMDKGLSVRQAEDFISVCAPYVDFIKLGWSTSYATPHLKEKLAVYKAADIPVYFGGTLLEVFIARKAVDDYLRLLDTFGIDTVEVSDGSLTMSREEKLGYIRRMVAAERRVLSEVGSKDAEKVLTAHQWVEYIKQEMQAGSSYVITEAREGGNVGVFRNTGEVRGGLIETILHDVPHAAERVLFEAPKKEQQVYFIKLLGTEVNLGNIAPEEVIGLETLRLGLRGDTFHTFLKGSH